MTSSRIRVAGPAPYDVLVGRGLLGELLRLVTDQAHRVAVIHPAAAQEAATEIITALGGGAADVLPVAVPGGERAKTVEVAAGCWQRLAVAGFTRDDVVVGVGGGATTDLAGFVAATFLRGIRVVSVPTTLLGMVDAAVGGKTGINTAEGKNLVGAFHEPTAVVCDLDTLATLPPAEMISGLAEVAKCGFIADPAILDLLDAHGIDAQRPGTATVRELVERSVTVKAGVVASDLTERTSSPGRVGREALNYGHTFGHAVEAVEDYTIRHGEAVAIGMVYVAELARRAGVLDPAVAARHRQVLASIGLPTTYPQGRWPELHTVMRRDKKTRGDHLRFVVLEGLSRPAVLEAPEESALVACYETLAGG